MGHIRSAGVVCLVVTGALGCGREDDQDLCPAPHQAMVGPNLGPDLSSVPACKLPDPEQ